MKSLSDYKAAADRLELVHIGAVPLSTFEKTQWKCKKCAHEWPSIYNNIARGYGCPSCAGTLRKTTEDYRKLALTSGLEFLDEKAPSNARTACSWKCKAGHPWSTTYNKVQQGRECPKCSGHAKLKLSDYQNAATERGYAFVQDEIPQNNGTKTEWICSNGHIWESSYSNFTCGKRCPKCSQNGSSKEERELSDWVQSLGLEVKDRAPLHDVETGGYKSLDIVVENKNIAIEYCGIWWHHENSKTPRTAQYHKRKMLLAKKANLRLITIFSDEWTNRKDQIKDYLCSVLGEQKTKIGARKTELVVGLDRNIAKDFLNKYHIQGARAHSEAAFGLFYEKELIAVMTCGAHHRGGKDLVLDRLAFKAGVSVAGGASKMFKALCTWGKKNNYQKIISWSDNRWSEGAVYKAMGFELETELPPDYSYVGDSGIKRFSKQSLKKTESEKLTGKTEKELRTEQGYSRIWDCGKKRWIFNIGQVL